MLCKPQDSHNPWIKLWGRVRSSIEAVARDAQISPRHVRYFLSGDRRASSRLLDAIRAALGDAGWAFATGQADSLREETSPNATA